MRVDRDAGHADIALHAGVVRIVAAVGCKIERDGEPLLAGGDIAPVESVTLFRRREAGVLADGPGLRDVHRRVGPADEGGEARIRVEEVEARRISTGVDRLDVDPFGRGPGLGGGACRAIGEDVLEVDLCEVGQLGHGASRWALGPDVVFYRIPSSNSNWRNGEGPASRDEQEPCSHRARMQVRRRGPARRGSQPAGLPRGLRDRRAQALTPRSEKGPHGRSRRTGRADR